MCSSEVSDIEHSIWQAYQDRGVVVWGVGSEEDPEVLRAYADAFGLTFPILVDSDGAVSDIYRQRSAFATAAYPQDWIIGREGDVVYANNGFELDAMVSALESELRD